jgi:hypothetical protein
MKRYIARQVLIAKLAALALSAICFLQAPVRAQETTYNVIFPSVGLASGQRVSFTFFNANGTPVRAQLQIHNAGGIQVGFGDGSVRFLSYSIQAGAFYSFNINHSDIRLLGEAGTGRKQIRASVSLTFSEEIKPVIASMEIIEVTDGTSNTIFVGELYPSAQSSGGGRDVLVGGDARDVLMGVLPDQKARVTVLNPPASGSEAQREPVSGHVKVFDGSGNLIAQSPEMVIPSGEFRSVNFDRYALSLAGEPDTNRAQVRIKPFFNFESERLPALQGDDRIITSLVSFEVVDKSKGKTVLLTGQQCLVYFLGGMPSN